VNVTLDRVVNGLEFLELLLLSLLDVFVQLKEDLLDLARGLRNPLKIGMRLVGVLFQLLEEKK